MYKVLNTLNPGEIRTHDLVKTVHSVAFDRHTNFPIFQPYRLISFLLPG
jgi:hypothetical protein